MSIENLEQASNFAAEDSKISLLMSSVYQINKPAFLCIIKPDNPNFLEIIECNNQFLECFDIEKNEVIGVAYDFLFQDKNVDYGSVKYSSVTTLAKSVKNLQVSEVQINISYPKDQNKSDNFKITFVPSGYKTKNIYCFFSFKKIENQHTESIDTDKVNCSSDLIENLERALRNERILRNISDVIDSDLIIEEIFIRVLKMVCQYLKVDRCIINAFDGDESKVITEYCDLGVKRICDVKTDNKISPIKQYIDFHREMFFKLNSLKSSNKTMVFENLKNYQEFVDAEDLLKEFSIGSQIVVMMAANNDVIGGIYIQQSFARKWFLEEIELVEIIANQISVAIDRSNYTAKLSKSNHALIKKAEELERALSQEKKMREIQSEFVALVSHEFKTPLQIIDGAREVVLRKVKSLGIADESLDKTLERIKSAASRMNGLIQNNLILTQIEIKNNGVEINKKSFDINHLVKDVIEKNTSLMTQKNIIIKIDIDELPTEYEGDQKLLDHAFNNMVSNAVKYSKNDSTVRILGGIKESELFLEVKDGGIGIPKDDLAKIGSKFFRAKNTLSVAGTGIGLYLTKNFVDLHGGRVVIESELNIGTTITAFLPISNKSVV